MSWRSWAGSICASGSRIGDAKMNLYTFSFGILHLLVDLVNHLWYWLGDFLPWWFGDFFDAVGDFAASHGHMAVMAILVEVLIILIIALINVLNFIWLARKFRGTMFDVYGRA